jgi:hypothetical protein
MQGKMQGDKYRKGWSSRELETCGSKTHSFRVVVARRQLQKLRESGASRVLDRLILALGLMYASSEFKLEFNILVGIH